MLDWILIAGLAWVVIGFDWNAQKQENLPAEWVNDGTLVSYEEGGVKIKLIAQKGKRNTVSAGLYRVAAKIGNEIRFPDMQNAGSILFEPMGYTYRTRDEAKVASELWVASIPPNNPPPEPEPQPENPRPELPDGGPASPTPPPSTPSLPSNPYGPDFNLGGGLL